MSRAAKVFLDGVYAGRLRELDRGVTFAYDAEYVRSPSATPISLTLPIRLEPYRWDMLPPFFANLLPEGWLLEISVTKLKVARDDLFGLLLATCRDCVGAVEIVAEETG